MEYQCFLLIEILTDVNGESIFLLVEAITGMNRKSKCLLVEAFPDYQWCIHVLTW